MQLIALIYKDQHVNNLRHLLAVWLETELSESSEDNESNTSPQVLEIISIFVGKLVNSYFFFQDPNGSCSSPVLTSNETDDSSDGQVR